MQEYEWKQLKGIPEYEISEFGQIRNIKTGLILKQKIDRYGYPCIGLYNNSKRLYRTIHRLVASTFLTGEADNLQVNHKDGIKTNNHYSNLEWCTAQENIIHSFNTGLNSNTAHVSLLDWQENCKIYFRSIKSLGKYLNIVPTHLISLIKHSYTNKIFGRYSIDVNETAIGNLFNSKNFGKPIYVKDLVYDKVIKFNSILAATYYTSYRSLKGKVRNGGNKHYIGYMFSEDGIFNDIIIDKKAVLLERKMYVNKPYRSVNNAFILYDYYTGVEYKFNNIKSVVDFINSKDDIKRKIEKRHVSEQCSRFDKTGLLRGYGIKNTLRVFDMWEPWPEEVILSSKFGLPAPNRIYKVTKDSKVEIVVGPKDLINLLKLNYINFNLNDPKILDKIKMFVNDPTISINRLDNPIKNFSY